MVWADYDRPGNPIRIAHLAEKLWETAPCPAGDGFLENFGPSLAIAPGGDLLLVWAARESDEPPRIYFSRRRDGSWTAPSLVDPENRAWESDPAIAIDPEGNPWIAWSRVAGESAEIFVARGEDGVFGTPMAISRPDSSPDSRPAIAFSPDGKAAVAWEGWEDGCSRIFTSEWAGGWSEETAAGEAAAEDRVLASLRANDEGVLSLSWRETKGQRTLLRTNGGGWREARGDTPRLPIGLPFSESSSWVQVKNGEGGWDSWRSRDLLPHTSLPGRGRRSFDPGYHTLIGYGDSITYGHKGGSDTKGWYGAILRSVLLPPAFPGSEFYFYNEGYPQAETSDLLSGPGSEEWPCPGIIQVINAHPGSEKILIMGGTNDIDHGIPLPTAAWNISQMVDRARYKGLDPIMATVIPSFDSIGAFNAASEFRSLYLIPLAQAKLCRLADPWRRLMDYYPSDYFWQELYGYPDAWDGIHPAWPEGDLKIAEAFFSIFTQSPPRRSSLIDYNGDGTSEIAVFRAATGLWAVKGITRCIFGRTGDWPVPADFNGDGTTEIAIFRPATGLWKVKGVGAAYFGATGDVPLPADYNGDGTEDVAIFRSSSGLWRVRDLTAFYYGQNGDVPFAADFSGDGIPDPGVFRPINGLWAIRGMGKAYFGQAGDFPVPGDYTGDGTVRIAILRPEKGLWAVKNVTQVRFGYGQHFPQPGEWNGGPGLDIAGYWNTWNSTWAVRDGGIWEFGQPGDFPVAARVFRGP